MRCIQSLNLLRRQRERERDSVFLHMGHRAGFGDSNDIPATNRPGQRDRGWRATVDGANTCERGIMQQFGALTAQRRIRHDRHALPLAPWQQVTLNASIVEAVGDLVGRAAVAVWHMEQLVHLADRKVRDAPSTSLPRRAQAFERRDNARQAHDLLWPVQKVEIEMIYSETGKARLARARDAVSRHVSLPDFGDQENTISLTGNRTADKFLGPVQLRRVDQRHPEGKACAQRFFFSGLRVSPLSKTPRPLTESRDDGAIAKLDCSCRGGNGDPRSTLAPGIRSRSKHRPSREERRCAKSGEVASVQQSVLHVFGLMRLLQRTDRRSQKTSGRERISSGNSSTTSRPVSVTISDTANVWPRKMPKRSPSVIAFGSARPL